jgi:signal transduction histidine kinase
MQSGTALVEICKTPELWGEEAKGAFGALQFVSRRLDLGIADEIEECGEGCIEREPRPHKSELRSLAGAERFQGPTAERVGLSHDVGNLLAALGFYAELLASPGVLHEDYREYAEDLRLLSQRSTAMTSRLMQCGVERYREINDSMTLLPDVIRGMRGVLSRIARCRIEIELGRGSSRPVNVPGEAVERILVNLVKNASEAIEDSSGYITNRVEEMRGLREERLVMTIFDTGRGMTEVQLSSLGGLSWSGTGGRGVGFRVVRELAAMSNGVVSVASTPGEGTTVGVEWPVIEQMQIASLGAARTVTRGAAGWIGC